MQQVRFYLLRTIETSHLPNQNPESREVKEQYVLPMANVTVAKRGSQNNDVASAVKMPSAPDTPRGEQKNTHTSSHSAQRQMFGSWGWRQMQSIFSTTTTSTCRSSTWNSLRLVFRKHPRQTSRRNAYNVAPQHQ